MKVPEAVGLFDDHVHSMAGSADAHSTVTELCRSAIEHQLKGICFTEHLDFNDKLSEYGYYVYEKAYRAIEEAREQYAGQLEIRMGLEVDFESRFLPVIEKSLSRYPVDFLLGAIHMYQGKHFIGIRDEMHAGMPVDELATLYQHYFAESRILIRSGCVDCLAHLDYPAKIGLRTVDGRPIPNYVEELEETVSLAVTCGIGLEVNTRYADRGAPLAAPETAIQRYISLGGRTITLGSDAHRCEQLAESLEIGRNALLRAGLPYQTVFRGRRAERNSF